MGRSAHHRSEPGRCACRPKDSHRWFAPSRLAYREARHSAASTSCARIARSGAKDRVRAPRVRSASATRVTRSACAPPEPGHIWYRIFQARKIEVEIGEWRGRRSRGSRKVGYGRGYSARTCTGPRVRSRAYDCLRLRPGSHNASKDVHTLPPAFTNCRFLRRLAPRPFALIRWHPRELGVVLGISPLHWLPTRCRTLPLHKAREHLINGNQWWKAGGSPF